MKWLKCLLMAALVFSFPAILIAESGTSNKNEWIPYNFKGGEEFHYKLQMKDSEGLKEGDYVIKVSKAESSQFTVNISGNFDKKKFETTFTTDRENLYVTLMGQMMFNPAGAPLLVTLFAPWWNLYFVGKSWKVGNGWSFTDEEGREVSFKVEDICEHAGKKGYKAVMRENKEPMVITCISPEVALPLYIYLKEEEGNSYTLELLDYKE